MECQWGNSHWRFAWADISAGEEITFDYQFETIWCSEGVSIHDLHFCRQM